MVVEIGESSRVVGQLVVVGAHCQCRRSVADSAAVATSFRYFTLRVNGLGLARFYDFWTKSEKK